jgi:tetratricopeptide (TPR) repeat protein
LLERGQLRVRLGLYEEAIHDYDRAIDLDPNNATPHYLKAQCFENLGHIEKVH